MAIPRAPLVVPRALDRPWAALYSQASGAPLPLALGAVSRPFFGLVSDLPPTGARGLGAFGLSWTQSPFAPITPPTWTYVAVFGG